MRGILKLGWIGSLGLHNGLLENDKARVRHIERQASDHCMLLLDTNLVGKTEMQVLF